MTKGELQEKANQFNSSASQVNAPNRSNVSYSAGDLRDEWDSVNGRDVVSKMMREARKLEDGISSLEKVANSVQGVKVTVSFEERVEEEVI